MQDPIQKKVKKPSLPDPPGSSNNPVLIYNALEGFTFEETSLQNLFFQLSKLPFELEATGELSIAFLPDDPHTELHITHHQNPEPTDVITFRGDSENDMAGEICISPEFAQEYCEENGGDFSREVTLYLVHGWLHLCGLDDLSEEERVKMREGEKVALKHLESVDAIPEFRFLA